MVKKHYPSYDIYAPNDEETKELFVSAFNVSHLLTTHDQIKAFSSFFRLSLKDSDLYNIIHDKLFSIVPDDECGAVLIVIDFPCNNSKYFTAKYDEDTKELCITEYDREEEVNDED